METYIVRMQRPKGLSRGQTCALIRQALKPYQATVRREFTNDDNAGYTYTKPQWSTRTSSTPYPGNR